MPRSPPSTRSKVKRSRDKQPVRRSISLSPPSTSSTLPTTMPASAVSLSDMETTITKCLSQDSFVSKLVDLLCAKVKDAVVGTLTESLREARAEIEDLRREVASLKSDIKGVEHRVTTRNDDLEQYTRRHNLRVFGVPEGVNEDTDTLVMKIFTEQLKLDIPLDRLDRTHRVGKKPGPAADGKARWRPIIVRFSSYRDRRKVFNAKKLLKGSGITVREDLTSGRAELLRAAISKFGVRNVWTSDGRIHWLHNGIKGAASRVEDLQ